MDLLLAIGIEHLSEILGIEAEGLDRLVGMRDHAYQHRRIPKKRGGWRPVDEPSEELKQVQRLLLHRVLRGIAPHSSNYCVPGRGIVRNAQQHLGPRWVYVFDIADAYKRTRRRAVRRPLRQALTGAGLLPDMTDTIVSLCMLSDSLPQGAPSSGVLLDLALRRTDDRLSALADEAGGRYSRYADDLTLSFPRRRSGLVQAVADAVGLAGLRLNHDKDATWSPPKQATVTGLILRRRVGVPASFVNRARSSLRIAEDGLDEFSRTDWESLQGLISYIESVQPGLGRKLRSRFTRFPRP